MFKKFAKEFKDFISRGNVMDMAVGVIVGGAFTAIVTALTNGILRPLINWAISAITGGAGLEGAYTILKPAYDAEGAIDLESSIYIDWGALLSAIVNFLLVALILFFILKAFNYARDFAKRNASMDAVIAAKQAKGLKLTRRESKYLAAKEQAAKEAEEAKKKAEEEAAKPTRTEELLIEIRDAIKNK